MVLSHVLCDKTSIEWTYYSNHTFQLIWGYRHPDHDTFEEFAMLVDMNLNEDEMEDEMDMNLNVDAMKIVHLSEINMGYIPWDFLFQQCSNNAKQIIVMPFRDNVVDKAIFQSGCAFQSITTRG